MLFRERAEELLSRVGVTLNGKEPWDPQIHDNHFYARVFRDGTLGLGESYLDGWWDCDDLSNFFAKVNGLVDEIGEGWLGDWLRLRDFAANMQTVRRARKVADGHYNFGNELFSATLGASMAYTCGYWSGKPQARNLDEAQAAKYDLICRKLKLEPLQLVLDIGCGWGGFAKFAAAAYGVRVVGITISREQAEFARHWCRDLPIEIRLADYRRLPVENWFDAAVVCGMMEHVGRKNHRVLMEQVRGVLKPGGLFLLHTIGNNASRRVADPWINRHIFPNGLIPSEVQIAKAKEGLFAAHDFQNFGPDYDPTLMAWWNNFDALWPGLVQFDPVKYDARFYRMWRYYLLSCAGVFRAGGLQLWQYVFSKGPLDYVYQAER